QFARAEDAHAAVKQLEGNWKVIKVEFEGEALPKAKVKEWSVEIKGDRLTFVIDKERVPSRLVVRGRAKIRQIDLHPERGKRIVTGDVVRGIYKIQGKQLWLCINSDQERNDRPKEFRSIAGTAIKVFVLERKGK